MRKLKFNERHITMIVAYHCLSDVIECYATDYGMNDLVKLASDIRKEGNRYEQDFIDLSDFMKERIESLNYNNRQMLPALCYLLYRESIKIREYFLKENARKEFTLLEPSQKIRDYFKGEFMSKEMIKAISDIILEIRMKNFVY